MTDVSPPKTPKIVSVKKVKQLTDEQIEMDELFDNLYKALKFPNDKFKSVVEKYQILDSIKNLNKATLTNKYVSSKGSYDNIWKALFRVPHLSSIQYIVEMSILEPDVLCQLLYAQLRNISHYPSLCTNRDESIDYLFNFMTDNYPDLCVNYGKNTYENEFYNNGHTLLLVVMEYCVEKKKRHEYATKLLELGGDAGEVVNNYKTPFQLMILNNDLDLATKSIKYKSDNEIKRMVNHIDYDEGFKSNILMFYIKQLENLYDDPDDDPGYMQYDIFDYADDTIAAIDFMIECEIDVNVTIDGMNVSNYVINANLQQVFDKYNRNYGFPEPIQGK
jgi:hypothetical protein